MGVTLVFIMAEVGSKKISSVRSNLRAEDKRVEGPTSGLPNYRYRFLKVEPFFPLQVIVSSMLSLLVPSVAPIYVSPIGLAHDNGPDSESALERAVVSENKG